MTQQLRPDSDLAAAGWAVAPLWSKIDEAIAAGDVITADVGGGSGVGNLLTWPPPTGWASYTPLDVTAGGDFSLSPTVDYKIVNQTVNGHVRLNGGRNIVAMGLGINQNAPWGDPLASDYTGLIVSDNGATLANRMVHLEGLKVFGSFLGDGLKIDCPSAIVQLQNYYDALSSNCGVGIHADIIQAGGGALEVRIDKMTAFTDTQGINFTMDSPGGGGGIQTRVGPYHVRRVDIHEIAASGEYLIWLSTNTDQKVYVDPDTFWIETVGPRRFDDKIHYNYNDVDPNRRPVLSTDALGEYASYPNMVTYNNGDGYPVQKLVVDWAGTGDARIRHGVPPGGSYVDPTLVGNGYVSPGYAP
jgi:hypothetical protein